MNEYNKGKVTVKHKMFLWQTATTTSSKLFSYWEIDTADDLWNKASTTFYFATYLLVSRCPKLRRYSWLSNQEYKSQLRLSDSRTKKILYTKHHIKNRCHFLTYVRHKPFFGMEKKITTHVRRLGEERRHLLFFWGISCNPQTSALSITSSWN